MSNQEQFTNEQKSRLYQNTPRNHPVQKRAFKAHPGRNKPVRERNRLLEGKRGVCQPRGCKRVLAKRRRPGRSPPADGTIKMQSHRNHSSPAFKG